MVLVYGMADSCLYNQQNNTWMLGDMEFIFSCSHSISHQFDIEVNSLKINSISPHARVLFSIYYFLKHLSSPES